MIIDLQIGKEFEEKFPELVAYQSIFSSSSLDSERGFVDKKKAVLEFIQTQVNKAMEKVIETVESGNYLIEMCSHENKDAQARINADYLREKFLSPNH